MDDTTPSDTLDQSYIPGLTSHTSTLAEYHAVTTMFGADVSALEIGRRYQDTIDAQRDITEAWASAHGLEIDVVTEHELLNDGRVAITTTWVVQIGRGDIDREQTPPGSLDRWRWSARVGHWRALLQGLGREGRRLAVREDGLASVTHLHRHDGTPDRRPLVTSGHIHPSVEAMEEYGQRVREANDGVGFEQASQSGYLPGTGPAEHRPAWLQRAEPQDSVGGDWSDT